MTDLAVALLDGAAVAAPLARHAGVEVEATTRADHLDVAQRLGRDARLVVGLAPVPWPRDAALHAAGSARLPAYTGVVSWHRSPALVDRLAQAVAPAADAGAHVLITAPDPGPEVEPEDLVFLREVASDVAARVDLPRRSVAWRGATRAPTTVDALEALVAARGTGTGLDVLECPVAPGTGGDPGLAAAGERLGARVTAADLSRTLQVEVMAAVLATVAAHEGLG